MGLPCLDSYIQLILCARETKCKRTRVFLAMFFGLIQVQGVLTNQDIYQLGQAPEIVSTFSAMQQKPNLGLEIALSLLGS